MLKSKQQHKQSQEYETRPTLDTIIIKSLKTMPICVSNVPEKDEKKSQASPEKKTP